MVKLCARGILVVGEGSVVWVEKEGDAQGKFKYRSKRWLELV